MVTLIFKDKKETYALCDKKSNDIHKTLCKARQRPDVQNLTLVRILRD